MTEDTEESAVVVTVNGEPLTVRTYIRDYVPQCRNPYTDEAGTVCSPFITFGHDTDTGMFIYEGEVGYAVDGITATREEFFMALEKKGTKGAALQAFKDVLEGQ